MFSPRPLLTQFPPLFSACHSLPYPFYSPLQLHTTAAVSSRRKNDACPKTTDFLYSPLSLLSLWNSASLYFSLLLDACTTLHPGRQAENSGDGRFPVCQAFTCEGPRLPSSSQLTDTLIAPKCTKAPILPLLHTHTCIKTDIYDWSF